MKSILNIAIPNGFENGVFQLVNVALFGTYQIAANGVAQSIWSLAAAMALATPRPAPATPSASRAPMAASPARTPREDNRIRIS